MGSKALACTRAHSAATIRETGDVFFCCHGSPNLGNIRRRALPEILASDEARGLKNHNRTGTLPCRASCPHLHHFTPAASLVESPFLLEDLLLMVALDCNIACTMCYQANSRVSSGSLDGHRLDAALLRQQVPFDRINRVVIQGGEPTVIPEVLDLLDYLNRLPSGSPSVSLVTNGLSLPPSVLECVRTRSEFVYISINGATPETHAKVNRGSNWEVVRNNIDQLHELRTAAKNCFTIVGGFTIVPQNIREIPLFLRTFQKLGFDTVSFNYDVSSLRLLRHDQGLRATLQDQIAADLGSDPTRLGRMAKLAELGLLP